VYAAVVALIVAAAARAADWLARLAGYRIRWIWAGALALTLYLSASALLPGRGDVSLAAAAIPPLDLGGAAHAPAGASWGAQLVVRIAALRKELGTPVRVGLAAVHGAVSPAADTYVALLSSVISVGLLLALIGVGRRFRRARRAWPLVTMEGVDVRIAPHIGPVVVGFVRPEIVVPRWLLARHADDQRMVVTHEDEHIRARDPLLLGLAWSAVVVAPWNPALWYMLSRLRLAVELDCDARVLRRGAAPRSYGSLLIDVAQHASVLRLSALALADDSSHLYQRILAMKPTVPRFARLRGGLAAAFALAGVLVACQASLPTDAEIERMDVATAARAARELAKARHADTAVAYAVDGTTATASDASALAAAAVARVQIVTGAKGTPTQINIQTREPASTTAGDSGRVLTIPVPIAVSNSPKPAFTGVILIDGVRSTEDQMKALDPRQIESVEVIKGPSAALHFSDPDAAKGVITIKTKRAGE
jgi:hypothetical protein